MTNVFDVACYILEKQGEMTAMKLQKLVYYAQAWSLVWDESPLFSEQIQAWANGPVIPALYEKHRGQFKVTTIDGGDAGNLSDNQKDTIDKVLEFYGNHTSHWLSDLTHSESPWLDAREGLHFGERGRQEISLAAMAEYYEGL